MQSLYRLLNLIVLSFVITVTVQAQTDTLHLSEVEVVENKPASSSNLLGSQPLSWLTFPLSEISYRSTGVSGVGSISFRGMPANQTTVSWEGLPLVSALQGQFDAGQYVIPSGTSLEISTQVPVQAGLRLPASIEMKRHTLLTDSMRQGMGASLTLGAGLYSTLDGQISLEARSNKWGAFVQANLFGAKNDYRIYRSGFYDPSLPHSQINASTRLRQGQFSVSYGDHKDAYSFRLATLLNEADRNLPPPISKYFSRENLSSQTTAVSFNQKLHGKNISYQNTAGIIEDRSNYRYENGSDNDRFGYRTLRLTGDLKWEMFSTFRATLIHSLAVNRPILGQYPNVTQWMHSYGGQVDHSIKRFSWQAGGYVNMFRATQILQPNAVVKWLAVNRSTTVDLTISTQGVFRAPTLNDLYYPRYGNSLLKPEQGRSYEVRASFRTPASEHTTVSTVLTPFLYVYDQFILWLPESNFWTSRLLERVRVSGLTLKAAVQSQSKLAWRLGGEATYAQGGQGGALVSFAARPQPFLYSSPWRVQLEGAVHFWKIAILLRSGYVGDRYTAADDAATEALSRFWLHSFSFEYNQRSILSGKLKAGVQANLAIPYEYRLVPNYASPAFWGRIYVNHEITTRSK